MAECRIEVITYEQSRLEYFKELQNRQKKRFEQFEKSSAIKELKPQERHYQLSKMGEVLQYYDDIVKMLEDCTRTPKERSADKQKITCLNCKHLMFSDMYGECNKQLKIVNPSDTCEYAEPKERGEEK